MRFLTVLMSRFRSPRFQVQMSSFGSGTDLSISFPFTKSVKKSPGQPDLTIDYVVDTGYTDYLTLPHAAVAAMGLHFLHWIPADLADDSTVEIEVYRAAMSVCAPGRFASRCRK